MTRLGPKQGTWRYNEPLDSSLVTQARKKFKKDFGYNPNVVCFHPEQMPENVLIMAGLEVKEADWPLLKYHFAVMRVES